MILSKTGLANLKSGSAMKEVRIGDLVKFYSGFDAFQRGYHNKNPGIVLSVSVGGWAGKQKSAEVLWSDEKITTEHIAYLRKQ